MHALALGYDNFWCSAGVHPDNEDVREPSVDDLLALAAKPKVVAIGETGLDYYRLGGRSVADMEWQRAALSRPHPRRPGDRAAAGDPHPQRLRRHPRRAARGGRRPAPGGVFHCFTETAEVARAALDLGFYISFSGILTFKTAADLRDVAAFVPLDRCLIETDSPYLAPVPYRGKVNTPAYVPFVARQLAEVKGLPVEAVAAATSRNFERLFCAHGDLRNYFRYFF